MKFAAVVIAATIAGTSLASAQSVEFRAGPRHEGVYIGHDRDWRDGRAYYRDRDWRDSRAYYRDRDRGETVVIKKKRYYGRDYDHPRPGVTFRTW